MAISDYRARSYVCPRNQGRCAGIGKVSQHTQLVERSLAPAASGFAGPAGFLLLGAFRSRISERVLRRVSSRPSAREQTMEPRSDIQAAGADPIDRRCCYICKRRSPGDICEFWVGFCVRYNETDLGDEVLINAKYRDLHRDSVTVCDSCAAGLRRKHHRWGFIGWGLGFLACAVGIGVAAVTRVAGDGTVYLLGVLGLFAALAGLLAMLDAWQMRPGKWSPGKADGKKLQPVHRGRVLDVELLSTGRSKAFNRPL